MRKNAKDIKKGERIKIAGKEFFVEEVEVSEIGKQGLAKCRIVAKNSDGEKITIVRPENYPMDVA